MAASSADRIGIDAHQYKQCHQIAAICNMGLENQRLDHASPSHPNSFDEFIDLTSENGYEAKVSSVKTHINLIETRNLNKNQPSFAGMNLDKLENAKSDDITEINEAPFVNDVPVGTETASNTFNSTKLHIFTIPEPPKRAQGQQCPDTTATACPSSSFLSKPRNRTRKSVVKKRVAISVGDEPTESIVPKRRRFTNQDTLTADSKVSWTKYYFGCSEDSDAAEKSLSLLDLSHGLVVCSKCKQHVYNGQLVEHCILHLQMDEHSSGGLLPFSTCFDCLSIPSNSEQLRSHRNLHRRITNTLLLRTDIFHLPGNRRVCCICEKSFDAFVDLAAHLCYKHPICDTPYVCPICFAFRSSIYSHLMLHFLAFHNCTNQIFCPFCLRHFSLPRADSSISDIARALPDINVFSSAPFYNHLQQHLAENAPHQCTACRLQFLQKRECKIHEYLHHAGGRHLHFQSCIDSLPDNPDLAVVTGFNDDLTSQSSFQRIRFCGPKITLKCLECDELLRFPYQRHYAARIICPWCGYSSHCAAANVAHWQRVHAKSIFSAHQPNADTVLNITYTSPAYAKIPETTRDLTAYEACGGWKTTFHYCTDKHSSPGIISEGLLVCGCGYRTLLGGRMAVHLAVEGCGWASAIIDRQTRVRDSCFTLIDDHPKTSPQKPYTKVPSLSLALKSIQRRGLKTALWWYSGPSYPTPSSLLSVGLFSRGSKEASWWSGSK
ncbi:unnamed protein product [Protopolystoma xenopodis]|uniref:C2H2-type domain-containing protein n=1 Tax=Protopolystoma xenopodis TaxID=117903 RepID=A0A448XH05_9PLAT|nr:unnamed protein product [Protopolystoma xenopodis]